MNEEQWNNYVERSQTWAVRIGFQLLHSKAFMDMSYGPAIKLLNWIHEKVRVKVDKKKRGANRYHIINDGFSFTYREAQFRGLTPNQFARALKELCKFGFIDIKRHGSGMRGDFSLFVISERWKKFGTSEFMQKQFPKSNPMGYRKLRKINP